MNEINTGNDYISSHLSKSIQSNRDCKKRPFSPGDASVPYVEPPYPRCPNPTRLRSRRPTSWAGVIPVLIALLPARSNNAVMVINYAPVALIRRLHNISLSQRARTSDVSFYIIHRVYHHLVRK
jgi:hypothetical protein